MATSIPISIPVHAYTYHGATSNWDRDGFYGYIETNSSVVFLSASASTGYLRVYAQGHAYGEVYLNSAYVDAAANVDHVTVNVYWTNGYKYVGWFVYQARLECRLYVNCNYIGTEISSFPAESGNDSFNFDVDIDAGDDLDVDIKLIAEVGNGGYGYAELKGTFTAVSFTSP